MADFEEGKFTSAIQIRNWKQVKLHASLFPKGHNTAYTCEIVTTRPNLPTAYPADTMPQFSGEPEEVHVESSEFPGTLAQKLDPLSSEILPEGGIVLRETLRDRRNRRNRRNTSTAD